jgi:hypothetical protein
MPVIEQSPTKFVCAPRLFEQAGRVGEIGQGNRTAALTAWRLATQP